MSPVCLSPIEIKDLLTVLYEYGAKALLVKNIIQMTTTDCNFGKFEVWVDIWPNFNAFVIRWDWTNTPVPCIKNYYYEFSLNNESLMQLLETPGLIQLDQGEFVGITEERRSVLEVFAEKYGYHLLCNNKYYDIFSVTQDTLINMPAPADLTVGSLTSEYAELVARQWEYTEEDKFDNYKDFIKLLINTYPTACLYNSKNQPVAYALGQEYGGIGMLYVDPIYRGRGCAKAIMSILSLKYLSKDIEPFIVVDIKNLHSINLNKKLGYESTHSKINWYTPVPKMLLK